MQFVPRNFVERCHLLHGDGAVALVDCLGRRYSVVVDITSGASYIREGWREFLMAIDAVRGDSLMLSFESIRTCKVSCFNGRFGWQKYPKAEEHHMKKVLMPTQSGVLYCNLVF